MENTKIDLSEKFTKIFFDTILNEQNIFLEDTFKEIYKIYFDCFDEMYNYWNGLYSELFDSKLPYTLKMRAEKKLEKIFKEIEKEYLAAKEKNGKVFKNNQIPIKMFDNYLEMDKYFNENNDISLICLNNEGIHLEIIYLFQDFITCINDAFIKYKIKTSKKYSQQLNAVITERAVQEYKNPDIELNLVQIVKKALNDPLYESNSARSDYQTIQKAIRELKIFENDKNQFQLSTIHRVIFK